MEQRPPTQRGADRFGLVIDQACGDVDEGRVAAVPVVEDDMPEAVVGQTAPDAGQVVDDGVGVDGDSAGVVQVVLVEGVGHRVHDERRWPVRAGLLGQALHRRFRDGARQ